MKQISIAACALLLLLSACKKDDDDDDHAVICLLNKIGSVVKIRRSRVVSATMNPEDDGETAGRGRFSRNASGDIYAARRGSVDYPSGWNILTAGQNT